MSSFSAEYREGGLDRRLLFWPKVEPEPNQKSRPGAAEAPWPYPVRLSQQRLSMAISLAFLLTAFSTALAHEPLFGLGPHTIYKQSSAAFLSQLSESRSREAYRMVGP